MGRITAFFLERFRTWEAPAQIGFLMALLLLFPAVIVTRTGPESLRFPALIAVMGLIVVAQLIFMWANRHMVTPYAQAQRLYRAGDLVAARDVLATLHAEEKATIPALTLLGNTYRQLGQLYESESILFEALNRGPDHYFPRYGFGRTLLAQGRYTEAASAIAQALADGAPAVVRVDLAEAYYRAGQGEEAAAVLDEALPLPAGEPHRVLMMRYLQAQLGAAGPPPPEVIRAGLPYWQAQAERFAATAYGADLKHDIEIMQAWL